LSDQGAARTSAPRRRRASRPAIKLVIPSETSFLGMVREMTRRMAELAGFDEATGSRIALAVDEATTNVIEHAYGGATDREVEIHFDDQGNDFRIEILDTGVMVDPRAVPRVDIKQYVTERRTGGLGVHLMEKIMDSVTYRRSARRNVCCMVKRKEAPAPPAAGTPSP
jgi:anti-sigma regulatory factor (Ser/Thr protein kinase)